MENLRDGWFIFAARSKIICKVENHTAIRIPVAVL